MRPAASQARWVGGLAGVDDAGEHPGAPGRPEAQARLRVWLLLPTVPLHPHPLAAQAVASVNRLTAPAMGSGGRDPLPRLLCMPLLFTPPHRDHSAHAPPLAGGLQDIPTPAGQPAPTVAVKQRHPPTPPAPDATLGGPGREVGTGQWPSLALHRPAPARHQGSAASLPSQASRARGRGWVMAGRLQPPPAPLPRLPPELQMEEPPAPALPPPAPALPPSAGPGCLLCLLSLGTRISKPCCYGAEPHPHCHPRSVSPGVRGQPHAPGEAPARGSGANQRWYLQQLCRGLAIPGPIYILWSRFAGAKTGWGQGP